MAGSLVYRNRSLSGANLLYFTQGRAGHHERKLFRSFNFIGLLPAQRQAEAVHGHHSQIVVVHLEEGTGVDRAALVVADGKQGLCNHGAQSGLLQSDGVLLVHGGQLGELLGIGT